MRDVMINMNLLSIRRSLYLTLFILTVSLFSYEKTFSMNTQSELKQFKKNVRQNLKKSSMSQKKRFYKLLEVGKKFHYVYKAYNEARDYYDLAIEVETEVDKSEVYIERVLISLKNHETDKLEKDYKALISYLGPQKKSKYKLLLENVKFFLEKKHNKKIPNNFYSEFLRDYKLKKLMALNEFSKAYEMIQQKNIEKADISTIAINDLLKVLNKKRNISSNSLHCKKTYQDHPHSYSYSMKICGLLIDYLNTGRVNKSNKADLKDFLKTHYPKKMYLFHAVSKL